jgi:prolipoprotein diacylglyceryltransferase
MNWIAGIPSPSSGSLDLGPLKLNAYGAMIALGVVAAVWLGGKRLAARGIGTTDDMSAIAMWGVPFGVVGARLYHVITDWQLFRDNPGAIVQKLCTTPLDWLSIAAVIARLIIICRLLCLHRSIRY